MGRLMHRVVLNGKQGQFFWDRRNAPSGTYTVLLRSRSGYQLVVERIVVQP
jgi:hypothetical protein